MSVCVCRPCLSVRTHFSGTTRQYFSQLSMAMARFSSCDVAICYVAYIFGFMDDVIFAYTCIGLIIQFGKGILQKSA